MKEPVDDLGKGRRFDQLSWENNPLGIVGDRKPGFWHAVKLSHRGT